MILENISKLINNTLYRSGPTQNIKIFIPTELLSAHKESLKTQKVIYATDDPSYAAGFCFDWTDSNGFRFGRVNNKVWTLFVPNSFKHLLNSSCSMYTITGDFEKITELKTPEFLSYSSCKVIKEVQFNNCYELLKNYGTNLIIK